MIHYWFIRTAKDTEQCLKAKKKGPQVFHTLLHYNTGGINRQVLFIDFLTSSLLP